VLGSGGTGPKSCPGPQINTGQLDTVVLLLVDVIGSIVISLSRCCLPNDEGPGPPGYFFLEPPLLTLILDQRQFSNWLLLSALSLLFLHVLASRQQKGGDILEIPVVRY